ncbi:MAG: hypothetical protein GTO55_00645 [Armatimonadetes bacterium]|nr:hypothetical protein [Armatimonadota bacterium]NIM22796.1 hypothetical protein [Armatimonadota bacterium]NIM66663.1 hypothetical protein [Armatimonadota bacterium]NIM75215.1 hypothetical protein [Armatimonadota bacterium]NIN04856.1 hypothetical protein [Armatimonadota bacterium]
MEVTQLAKPPIPEEANAAVIYRKAFDEMDEIQLSVEEHKLMRAIAFEDSSLDDEVVAAKTSDILSRNQRTLELIHQAAAMPECDFQRDWSEGPGMVFPEFAHLRESSRRLAFESMMLLHAGRVDDAVEACRANFRLSNAVDGPIMIPQLVRYAIILIASGSLDKVLRDSQPSSEVCLSIAEEIGEIELTPSFVGALKGERACGHSCFNMIRSAPNPFRALADFSAPLEESTGRKISTRLFEKAPGMDFFIKRWLAFDELTYLQLMGRVIKEASLPYREVVSIEPSLEGELESLHWFPPRVMTKVLMPVYSRGQLSRDKVIAHLRLAEVSLLLKAYKADLSAYPDSLAELEEFVGRGLPEDPFSGEGLVYHRDGNGFLLYSWGLNFKDDGGESPFPKQRHEGDIVIQCVR